MRSIAEKGRHIAAGMSIKANGRAGNQPPIFVYVISSRSSLRAHQPVKGPSRYGVDPFGDEPLAPPGPPGKPFGKSPGPPVLPPGIPAPSGPAPPFILLWCL